MEQPDINNLHRSRYQLRDLLDNRKGVQQMKFKIEKVANMIFITADQDIIFKAWDITEFTERKLQNTIKKINGHYNGKAEFIRTF